MLSLEERRNKHEKNAKYPKYHFHRAIQKYGSNCFEWCILDRSDSKDELSLLEQLYIAQYDSIRNGYNMTHGGDGGMPTEEVCKKIGNANRGRPSKYKGIPRSKEVCDRIRRGRTGKHCIPLTDEHKEKISQSNKGRRVSDDTKKKISIANTGRNIGVKYTDDHRDKISRSLKGKKKPSLSEEARKNRSIARKGKPWSEARRLAQNATRKKEEIL